MRRCDTPRSILCQETVVKMLASALQPPVTDLKAPQGQDLDMYIYIFFICLFIYVFIYIHVCI